MKMRNQKLAAGMNRSKYSRFSLIVSCLASFIFASCGQNSPPPVEPGPPILRLLSEDQYRNIIADVFGPHIRVTGRFNPLFRTNGLRSLGARSAEITPASMENFERMAQLISEQIFVPGNRRSIMPCELSQGEDLKQACVREALSLFGELLFRRPMTEVDISTYLAVAEDAIHISGSVYQGLETALARMLISPEFLFVVDRLENGSSDETRLSPHSIATRLSFFLWNTTPDRALLKAAETGSLSDSNELERQVDRMLASSKMERGLRNFFSDMLHFDEFATLEKDSLIYPLFNITVAQDAREETLRTIAHHLLSEEGDYRELFTTRLTFVSPSLARIYQIPVTRPDGGWTQFEHGQNAQYAGLLSQIGFSALHSHAGRSSPTLRGKAVREIFLCQKVPDPPGEVDFTFFNDPDAPAMTARERLDVHNTQPSCAGCHRITDPIGLGLEHLDSTGMLRETENGAEILVAGDLDGIPFTDIPSLGKALSENSALPICLVNRVYSNAMLRVPMGSDRAMIEHLVAEFITSGYKYKPLLRRIATSPAFVAVGVAKTSLADNEI
jgi:hypothetical protein